MMCLPDPDGMVLRANRVVEHWGLGSVGGVVGRTAHGVLHPACSDAGCAVASGLKEAWPKLRNGFPQEFEVYSSDSDRTLQYMLRPMRTGDDSSAQLRDARNVLVVSTAWVTLKREGPRLSLEVRDDGSGIETQADDHSRLHGSGIRNLLERADMTGGKFTLASLPGGGTSAQIIWLLDENDFAEGI